MRIQTNAYALTGLERGCVKKRILGNKIDGITIDSRLVEDNYAFIAIRGEKFDGNDFAVNAVKNGASFLVLSDLEKARVFFEDRIYDNISVIVVEDTLKALQDAARDHLKRMKAKKAIITGSVGKTTVKEMIRHIAMASGMGFFITPGNYNSQIGTPLSILSIDRSSDIMVFEAGMSQAGEIGRLARTIGPDLALILNIKDVHREFFNSIYEIRDAKLELIEFMDKNGTIVYYRDDEILHEGVKQKWDGRTIRYSIDDKYSIKPHRYACDGMGRYTFTMLLPSGMPVQDIRLSVPGIHNLQNAVASACLCDMLGIGPNAIRQGLSSFKAFSMRSNIIDTGDYIIYEDCYNSSPYALQNAIDAFMQIESNKKSMAILGDMLELGTESRRYHRESLQYAIKKGIDIIITIGGEFYGVRVQKDRLYPFMDKSEVLSVIKGHLHETGKILIKGSRGIGLETISEQLK